jgi:hypothetical protein
LSLLSPLSTAGSSLVLLRRVWLLLLFFVVTTVFDLCFYNHRLFRQVTIQCLGDTRECLFNATPTHTHTQRTADTATETHRLCSVSARHEVSLSLLLPDCWWFRQRLANNTHQSLRCAYAIGGYSCREKLPLPFTEAVHALEEGAVVLVLFALACHAGVDRGIHKRSGPYVYVYVYVHGHEGEWWH